MTATHGNLTASSPSGWILPRPIKEMIALLQNLPYAEDHVVLGGTGQFVTQEVQCLFATSGRYTPTLRAMFYMLAVATLCFRRENWVAGVTLGIVMVYSTIAAIHAIILVSIRHLEESGAMEMVSIATAGLDKAPEIPVWPMTWDQDCDAVLAIVGAGFLLVAPMMIWSGTFQQALGIRRNWPVLIGWAVLLFIGLICALVNEVHVDMWTVGQFRFCTADMDPSSFNLETGFNIRGRPHPNKSFNESIWDIFSNASASRGGMPICVYPCFNVSWPLRHLNSIQVMSSTGTWPSTSNYSNVKAGWGLMLASIILIVSSIAIMITIFIFQQRELLVYEDRGHVRAGAQTPLWLRRLDYGAKILTAAAFFLFLSWIEYTMQPYPYAERFIDVGQWGQLLSVILVLAVAAYRNIIDRHLPPPQEPTLDENDATGERKPSTAQLLPRPR